MGKLNDLAGEIFGMLTVVKHVGSNRFAKALWWCRCDCGRDCLAIGSALLGGHTKSCGCLKISGRSRLVHGARRGAISTRAYSAWCNLKNRCDKRNNPAWHNYGGRGIKYAKSWAKFENFLRDMGEPPQGLTLDRINNDEGYSKENCRWADRLTQRRNNRQLVWLTIDGKRMILKDAVAKCRVVSYQAAVCRIHRGWTPKDAVLTPYIRSDNKGYRAQKES